ncbi:UDP-3-O-acyl-N-acetylglucosamine deacetylase [Megasphaera sp. AM44-1BH]|jgi:UDP-3-O-[3-hydroxymyristoyl] N-acetylglucosamine deacetylase|uniref:UDP-3-O-acyl-N-acetylglucosamine deacetylase n=1 Tax=Megasphaera sp. AM44-1BH TaxID=2292358 RepID=UPI000E5411C0|nr:UDP-3-O-acyl-N-acetylglucosamine deacetylase [Megasphaera sp. AM44-1BH]RHA15704.1 UDP-3-O-[3-hydroxymyristoyl] N-acetylglucosamine deacetylase [Megasphaera sp. AM44-1BH]
MTNVVQTTLARPVSYSGIGLHAANEVHMVLRPAPADTGIVFVRTDLAGNPSVPAQLAYVTNTMRATTLEQGEAKVFTVEHLLSALQGMAVDNCIVEMDSVEPPVADGSSLTFVRLIEQAGIQKLDMPRRVLTVRRQHLVQEEDKFIAILPYDGFRITFTSINPHPLLGVQFSDTEITKDNYIRDIAFARTIAFTKELAMLKKLGLGKGGTLENTIVYDDTTCLSVLRSDDELVRHKVLDVIGDMALLGRSLKGHIIAVKSSHKLNNMLARQISEEMN